MLKNWKKFLAVLIIHYLKIISLSYLKSLIRVLHLVDPDVQDSVLIHVALVVRTDVVKHVLDALVVVTMDALMLVKDVL